MIYSTANVLAKPVGEAPLVRAQAWPAGSSAVTKDIARLGLYARSGLALTVSPAYFGDPIGTMVESDQILLKNIE